MRAAARRLAGTREGELLLDSRVVLKDHREQKRALSQSFNGLKEHGEGTRCCPGHERPEREMGPAQPEKLLPTTACGPKFVLNELAIAP